MIFSLLDQFTFNARRSVSGTASPIIGKKIDRVLSPIEVHAMLIENVSFDVHGFDPTREENEQLSDFTSR